MKRCKQCKLSVVTQHEPFDCPNCGAEVPAGAKACPECGSDERTGWNEEESVYDGTGIDDEQEFDYEKWLEKEGVKTGRRPARQWLILVAVIILLLAFLLAYLS